MTNTDKPKASKSETRAERLARQLRENLKKRKAQSRARREPAAAAGDKNGETV
jgi:hypothetical protein